MRGPSCQVIGPLAATVTVRRRSYEIPAVTREGPGVGLSRRAIGGSVTGARRRESVQPGYPASRNPTCRKRKVPTGSAMRGKGTGSKEEGARASVREGRTTRARTQQVIQDEEVHTPETPAPSTLTRGTPMTSGAGKERTDAMRQRRYRSRTFPSSTPADSDSLSPNVGGAFITPRLLFNRGSKRSQEDTSSSQGISKRGRTSNPSSSKQSPEKVPETPQIARGRSLSSAARSLDWNKNEVEDKHTITSVPANKFYGVSKDEDLKSTSFLVEIDGVFLRNEIYREIMEKEQELVKQRAKVEELNKKVSAVKDGKTKENRLMAMEERMETLDIIKSTIYIAPGGKAVQVRPMMQSISSVCPLTATSSRPLALWPAWGVFQLSVPSA
ncbi:hypothetical protein GUITHDRAFT_147076 [Guillardia theta CCMP2712]|uniref:Uncharacterized protein n=1 Tax=Guillardia theta (strain CCMP2712) TaxID=905079 RepID=L1IFG1_GUITC|nr:hypothetical protein GUITHDRAFT_147076 [Guillardia theta CCMP2712]EKX34654.1 hypothetical protein GUITHDRAFT_147076 [Guillardia theta CCMP2712]|eukprot:XP_005821634.1 hypothetical protein GUITHDRAFT_147076 [Guillardia theta CCMP2712]